MTMAIVRKRRLIDDAGAEAAAAHLLLEFAARTDEDCCGAGFVDRDT